MRIAIVSDIHGNLTAFEAVLADLRLTSPDLIFHGGDLADAGSSPVEIVDRILDLGWPGVIGNTDEMLWRPETLEDFASKSAAPASLWSVIREMAAFTRAELGDERIAWLGTLPRIQTEGPMVLLHASPDSTWKAPSPEASDAELESIYSPLGQSLVIYGHVHRPFVRSVSNMVIANTGSVSLSYDGDRRAAYLLLDDSTPTIRRVEYDVDKEVQALAGSALPHSDWIAKTLPAARPQMP